MVLDINILYYKLYNKIYKYTRGLVHKIRAWEAPPQPSLRPLQSVTPQAMSDRWLRPNPRDQA